MHKQAFNADFYLTAATVIPILYLALTLQGQTYETMVRRALTDWRVVLSLPRGELSWRRYLWRWWWHYVLFLSPTLAGSAILIAGVVGEWRAILALYNRSVSQGTSSVVLLALLVLVIAVTAFPAFRLVAAPFLYPERENDDEESPRLGKR